MGTGMFSLRRWVGVFCGGGIRVRIILKKFQNNGVIVIETKGDELDNSESAAKFRLVNQWAELAGKEFLYFIVFDKNIIDGSYTMDKAKELIKQL